MSTAAVGQNATDRLPTRARIGYLGCEEIGPHYTHY